MIYVDYLLSIGVPKENILVYEMDLATNYLLRDPLALVDRVLKDTEGKDFFLAFIELLLDADKNLFFQVALFPKLFRESWICMISGALFFFWLWVYIALVHRESGQGQAR